MSKVKNLIIVESPSKCATITKYLKSPEIREKFGIFNVIASYGHIRDLERKNLGLDGDLEPVYTVITDQYKTKVIKKLKTAIKENDIVWLAADLDREGEAIAWHIYDYFKLSKMGAKCKRITFNEITKDALIQAINNPREIDYNLVEAQKARRILDRIVGFNLTPLLWNSFDTNLKLSAGRVQSATLAMLVEKEHKIREFQTEDYYNMNGNFTIHKSTENVSGTVLYKNNEIYSTKKSDTVIKLLKKIIGESNSNGGKSYISNVSYEACHQQPPKPFITSTLQQNASSELKLSIKQTMQLAQELYEKGLITYMRTDSIALSKQALGTIGNLVNQDYGEDYYQCRNFGEGGSKKGKKEKKAKNAQEAHEAIRPSDFSKRTEDIAKMENMNDSHVRLYELIWKRTVASQMAPAEYYDLSVEICNSNLGEKYKFVGKTKLYYFDGYMKLWNLHYDPELRTTIVKYKQDINKKVKINEIKGKHIWKTPPAHYGEAQLVKVLEKEGLGRPSTYSGILGKLYDKNYIIKGNLDGEEKKYVDYILDEAMSISENTTKRKISEEKGKILLTDIGIKINDFLVQYFSEITDKHFTNEMEGILDDIAKGSNTYSGSIKPFYENFNKKVKEVRKKTGGENKSKIDTAKNNFTIGDKEYVVRLAKYGAVIQQDKSYISLTPYMKDTGKTIDQIDKKDIKLLISLPKTINIDGKEAELKYARYGFYIVYKNKNFNIFKNYIKYICEGDYDKLAPLISASASTSGKYRKSYKSKS